jgi:hypothetical protein
MSSAIRDGHAYTARYVLFTSGKGLHYKLDNNSNGMLEVIGFNEISKLIDGNVAFLNKLRVMVGLKQRPLPDPPLDAEAQFNVMLNNEKE